MYLHKRTYVGNKYRKPEQRLKIKYPKTQKDAFFPTKAKTINEEKITNVEEEVAYWRKVNAVHDWFVQNVQGGEDDCKDYYVELEKIEELVNLCNQVLKETKTDKPLPKDTTDYSKWADIKVLDSKLAQALLPSAEGFFFGGTDYDSDYLFGIKETLEQLEPLLKKDADGEYKFSGDLYYTSSW